MSERKHSIYAATYGRVESPPPTADLDQAIKDLREQVALLTTADHIAVHLAREPDHPDGLFRPRQFVWKLSVSFGNDEESAATA